MHHISLEVDFPVTYEIEQLGYIDRAEGLKVYSYPDATPVGRQQKLGDRPILRVTPEVGQPWVGVFDLGSRAEPRGVTSRLLAWPDRRSFCVVHRGGAVVVRADAPEEAYEIDTVDPVLGVTVVPRKRLIIFGDFTNLTAYGPDGLVWQSRRLALDDLRVEAVDRETLLVYGFFGGGDARFTVDLATGKASGQPFQPPD